MSPQRSMGPREKCLQAWNRRKNAFHSPAEAWVMPEPSSKSQKSVIDFEASQDKWKLSEDSGTHNGGDGRWRSANERGNTSTCTLSSSLRNSAIVRRDACRPVIWKTLRRARIYLWVDQQSKATSDQRWEDNPMQDGELCSLVVQGFRQVPAQVHPRHRRRRIHRVHRIHPRHRRRRIHRVHRIQQVTK